MSRVGIYSLIWIRDFQYNGKNKIGSSLARGDFRMTVLQIRHTI